MNSLTFIRKSNSIKISTTKSKKWWDSFNKWFIKYIHKTKDEIFFGTVFRVVFEVFLDLLFASAYNTYNMSWNHKLDYYSNIVSFIWLFLLLSAWAVTLVFYFWVKARQMNKSSKMKILFEDFKEGNKSVILDSFVFFMRRAALVAILIFGHNHGFIQALLFLIVWVGVLVFKVVVRPFEKSLLNFQDIVFELILIAILGIFITFKNESTELANSGRPKKLGTISFILVIMIILVNYITFIVVEIKSWREKRKKKNIIGIKVRSTKIRYLFRFQHISGY